MGVFTRPAARLQPVRLSLTLVLLLGAGTLSLPAQTSLRNLTGHISDRSHEPIKGAIVQVENQTTHSVRSYITDQTGRYSFKRLLGDSDYSVWVTFRGQQSHTRTLSSFDTKENVVIDFVVKLD